MLRGDFRGRGAKTVESCREVEKARRHDEEYCDGSALPRHDPSKEKQSGFEIIITKTRGACVITRFWPNQEMGRNGDGLEGYTRGVSLKRPCAKSLG